MKKELESLTKELTKLKASGASVPTGSTGSGGGGGSGGNQQKLIKRTEISVINPHTKQPYTMNGLVQRIELIEGNIGNLATNQELWKESQLDESRTQSGFSSKQADVPENPGRCHCVCS